MLLRVTCFVAYCVVCIDRLPHFSTYERENSALFRSHHSVKNRRENLSQKLFTDAKAQSQKPKRYPKMAKKMRLFT